MPTITLMVLLAVGLLWYGRFGPYRGVSLTGDDLAAFGTWERGDMALENLARANPWGRFRPVSELLLIASFSLFGEELEPYRLFNLCLFVLTAAFAAHVARSLGANRWVALSVGVLLLLSRFAVFDTMTAIGGLEILPLFFVLASVLFVARAYQGQGDRNLLLATATMLLAIHSHERFLAASLFVAAAYVLYPRKPLLWRMAGSVACLALLTATMLYQSVVLKQSFFSRTPLANVPLVLSQKKILEEFGAGSLNLAGFNNGRPWLFGNELGSMGRVGLWLGISFAGILLVAAVLYTRERNAPRIALLLLGLMTSTLLAGSITGDQEPRMLLAPYAVLLLLLAMGLARFGSLGTALAVAAAFLGLGMAFYYRPVYDQNMYLLQTERFADSTRKALESYDQEDRKSIIVVTKGNQLPQNWYFIGDSFFRLYAAPDARVTYQTEPPLTSDSIVLMPGPGDQEIVDLTNPVADPGQ